MGFSVNVLVYGDQLRLAQRCLESIVASAQRPFVDELRVAVNEPSAEVLEYVKETLHVASAKFPCYLYAERDFRNVGKYPLMRRMFYDDKLPLRSSKIMWFDDDSFLRDQRLDWWRRITTICRESELLGSRYTISARGNQYLGVANQPWFTGKPFSARQKMTFVTGGWWIASTQMLKRWNYPFPELKHNGGDSILGELVRQQGLRLQHYNADVAINADEQGRESKGERRGMSGKVPWPWERHQPGTPPDLSHHDFALTVVEWPCPN